MLVGVGVDTRTLAVSGTVDDPAELAAREAAIREHIRFIRDEWIRQERDELAVIRDQTDVAAIRDQLERTLS